MEPSVRVDSVPNFRDVGKTVNAFLGKKRMHEGLLFRSARPDEATSEDKIVIAEDLGIKTILDLRSQTEHIQQAKKFQSSYTSADPVSSTTADVIALYRINGVNYQDVSISGRAFEKNLLWQLTWLSIIKFFAFYICGYRLQAVSILGREVMSPRGLLGLATDMLDVSGDEIRETLYTFTDAHSVPALIHCTQGKDRTGLICAIILMILDIPISAIEHDYFLSDDALLSERDARILEIRQIGLSDSWASTSPDMIAGLKLHLSRKYEGLDKYLDSIGLCYAEREKLRHVLLC